MASKKKSGGLSVDECAYCSTTEGNLKKCTRCRLVCYCSKSCQQAHWKAQPGHSDRCIAPKDRKPRKPSFIQTKKATDKTRQSQVAEKDLCGVCLEPLLAENVLQTGVAHACTQTLVCKHSFHLKCASELTSLSSPLCPLCRGPFSSMLAETLFLDANNALDVVRSMVKKGQIAWASLPQSVETRIRSVLRKFLEAANCGHAGAQFKLGVMYINGQGVKQDFQEAAKWSRQAADQGYAKAQFNLGFIYEKGQGVKQDLKEAVKWYRRAAHQGLEQAQFNLGFMHESGKGVKHDFKEAVKWYRKAADEGFADAQSNLGAMYNRGYGVKQDLKEAVKWYRKAADQGFKSAQYNLGTMYENGQGVKQDLKEAANWHNKAADQGLAGLGANATWALCIAMNEK